MIYIDGAPDNLLLQNNYVSLDPTQDAVQEFRVETNNIMHALADSMAGSST